MPLKSIDEIKEMWGRIANKEYIKGLSKNISDQTNKLLEAKESYTHAITDEVGHTT